MPATASSPVATAAEAPRRRVHVDVAGRPYDIHIGPGLLQEAGARIAALRPGARVAIVTDANVAAVHLAAVEASLAAAGIEHVAVVVEPGEKTKGYKGLEQVVEALIGARIERRDLVLALGGCATGVVGVSTTSTDFHASSKSRLIKVRTFCALR